ncbi:MAG: phosphatidylserine decarboxylase [Candidatus Sumerlaeia bacterium]|nr:phosphatidylserine decarboxylase [Candidatus Sumerlaeia bacterium]
MASQSPRFPKSPLGIVAQAWKFIIPLAILSALLAALWTPYALAATVPLILFCLNFFRDPDRELPADPAILCSPGDGKVVSVLEVPAAEMPGGTALRVAVFLNVFNVHVQRTSCAGRVAKIVHKPGLFLNALNEKCSEDNENLTIWLDAAGKTVGIRQITGAIARRIVCFVKEGDDLARGERYGWIQFGSRVELFLPPGSEVLVKPGQMVVGGETPMARLAG